MKSCSFAMMKITNNTRWVISVLMLCLATSSDGQIPDGYYDSVDGLEGESLRNALYQIINNHDAQSYSSLWNHFDDTDQKSNGKVWDMYSDVPGGVPPYSFNFNSDQCGNYDEEGDCYNREHSFPKSWFNDDSPMNSDLFHVYPTDGYVNNWRSNWPYGQVGSVTWTSENGTKKGFSDYPGYTGTVFEPIDEYKGDFARTYFYMMTRYKNVVQNWNSDMLEGDNLSWWAENLLVEWAIADPVSEKEENRNNAVYQIQENRNPFIDHPEWIELIWEWTVTVSQEEVQEANFWHSNGTLYLDSSLIGAKVSVYSAMGQLINYQDASATEISLELQPGAYVFLFQTKEGNLFTKKVVVMNGL